MIRSLLLLFLLCSVLAFGQRIQHMPPMMEHVLADYDEDQEVSLFVQVPEALLLDWEKDNRLIRRGGVERYRLISLSIAELRQLVNTTQLTYLDLLWAKGQPLNDRMLLNNNVMPVHQGVSPIGKSLKGEGIMIGLIDSGIELSHPDFLDEDDETRVFGLWDMTYEFDQAHLSPYGFGSVWTKEQIDLGEAINHQDQPQWFGHGSTVTGSACADGSAIGNYGGVAPLSDMAIVSFDFNRPDFLPLMVLSVQYLTDLADEWSRPLVINASLGTYFGSHDGLDPAALYVDSLLEASPGRIMVAAAGNSNALAPYHLRTPSTSGSGFTWFEAENGMGGAGAGVFFEAWADTIDIHQMTFSMGADEVSEDAIVERAQGQTLSVNECLGQVLTDSLFDGQGQWLANAIYWAQYRGEQVQMQVFMPQVADPSLAYRFTASGPTHFDIWSTAQFGTSDIKSSGLPNEASEPAMADYVFPDRHQHMVSSFTCSDHVITVANYTNRSEYIDYNGETVELNATVGEIASTSSRGPSRVGLQKPDIAASGSIALSAGDFDVLTSLITNEPFKVALGGLHHRNGGTSMASPVVAGAAALFLEQCPKSTWEDFREAIHTHGQSDLFTGVGPDNTWGFGKLNTYATIASSSLSVEVSVNGGELTSSLADTYQWLVNGEPIAGANEQSITIEGDGVYSVQIEDVKGCTAISEGVFLTTQSELENAGVKIWNGGDKQIHLDRLQIGDRIDVYDDLGRSIVKSYATAKRETISVQTFASGLVHIVVSRDGQYFVEKIVLE